MLSDTYDVVVVGGGPAGVIAATQAGRAGARTLLVEKTARLGGTTINGGINSPGLFEAWGEQVISGIGWELVQRTHRESGRDSHDIAEERVDRMVYAYLCDVFVLEAGCDLLLHTMLADLTETPTGWNVQICTKGGLRTIEARQVIDCSGDANAVELAGYPIRVPAALQPGTLGFRLAGFDTEALDLDALNAAFRAAIEQGEVKASDGCWFLNDPTIDLTVFLKGHNCNHVVVEENARDSEGRTAMEVEGRRAVYRIVRFLRQQPGFEHLRVSYIAAETGVRETVTIEGKATVTLDDYRSGRIWDDAVSYAFYPIDIHGATADEWEFWWVDEGVVATIPRGALLPAGSRNLIVAGRCVSSDRQANGALRVQASCMAMGQAAGALAALAVQRGCDHEDVPLTELWGLLEAHGAIVPALHPLKKEQAHATV
jgi:hypothetical protein